MSSAVSTCAEISKKNNTTEMLLVRWGLGQNKQDIGHLYMNSPVKKREERERKNVRRWSMFKFPDGMYFLISSPTTNKTKNVGHSPVTKEASHRLFHNIEIIFHKYLNFPSPAKKVSKTISW